MLSYQESRISLTLRLANPTLYNFRANLLLGLCNLSCIWSDMIMTDHECAILVIPGHTLFPATYITLKRIAAQPSHLCLLDGLLDVLLLGRLVWGPVQP